jgi:hypothetical protein
VSPFTFVGKRIDRFVLPLVSRHALPVLKREYDGSGAHQILWHAWDRFGAIAEHIPARRPPGTRVMLSFAAASAALHRAVLHTGGDEFHATSIVAEIGAKGYRELSRVPWWLGRLVTFDTVTRLSAAARLMRWLTLAAPGDARLRTSPVDGSMNVQVHRCPAVELYRDLGIAHLSAPLVCDLERAAAEEWEAEITRGRTIADGHAACEFHLRSIAPQHGGRHAEQPLY